jgi:hypothetical protein
MNNNPRTHDTAQQMLYKYQMKLHRVNSMSRPKTTTDNALAHVSVTLRLTKELSDALQVTPLKGATSVLLLILETVQVCV